VTGPALPAALLAAVPDLRDATWSRLPGLSGGAWRADVRSGPACVARGAEPLEVEAARCAASLRVGPAVWGAAEGWLVTEHVAGPHVGTLELSRPAVLDEVAHLLYRWHRAPLEAPPRPLRVAREVYRERARVVDPGLVRALGPWDAAAARCEVELVQRPAGEVTGHLDVAANLLRTPHGLRLIDFEYVASADPNRELGQLVWEAELTEASAGRLTEAYWRPVGDGPRYLADVAAWAFVAGVTWTLWGAGDPDLALWTRRSVERLRRHWARAAVDDTP
jgi:hypothetical protein